MEKEYHFIKIELTLFGKNPTEDYREVIRREAKDGWKLVQIFAPSTKGYGSAAYFELIFERDKASDSRKK